MPAAKYDVVRGERRRLSASYMNFYIANDVVLVPTFEGERDRIALDLIQKAFPERRIVGIDCSDVIYGAGTLHCISQQQPKVKSSCN
jgi:agmatine deiminase